MTDSTAVREELRRRDWPALAVRLMWRFQVPVDADALSGYCEPAMRSLSFGLTEHWSYGTWVMWLKNRMIEAGMFPAGHPTAFGDELWSYSLRRRGRKFLAAIWGINDPDGLVRSLRSTYCGSNMTRGASFVS